MTDSPKRKLSRQPSRKKDRSADEIAKTSAYRAMLAEIVQCIKAFKKKAGGVKPRYTMRDLKKELRHGG